jgi:cysteine desulfurase/selenocysteine lyase
MLDVARVRREFPMLERRLHDRPLVYLDSAATSQKPRVVIEALASFYGERCASIHRGVHALAAEATRAYEAARQRLARFVGARDAREIVFLRGTTEAINLVSHSLRFEPGDEILVSELEHHSNLVPWQLACARTGAVLRAWPSDARGVLGPPPLTARTRLVAVTHVSNVLGAVQPIAAIAEAAHDAGALLLVDGAQAAPHLPIDVAALGCDFYALSGHKLFAPTGSGALWARLPLLDEMTPFLGGGDMIGSVRFAGATYQPPPHKFEAGTPAIAEQLALAVALDWLDGLDRAEVAAHEGALLERAAGTLSAIDGVRLFGQAPRVGVLSFTVEDLHPHDLGTFLDREGIAIRTGHHCAQPLMDRLGVPATARLSVAPYNTVEEIDALAAAVARAREWFNR